MINIKENIKKLITWVVFTPLKFHQNNTIRQFIFTSMAQTQSKEEIAS